MDYSKVTEIAKRTMTLFFIIDCSGSMYGSKIGAVNTAIEDCIPIIKEVSKGNSDAQIKVAALMFSGDCKWAYDEPKLIEDFSWNYINANGNTAFNRACKELNRKLSKNEYMKESTGAYAPVFIILSDGEPTSEYKEELEELKNNNWFKYGIKVAISIDDETNLKVLREFIGKDGCLINVSSTEALKTCIKFVTLSSSNIGSRSSSLKRTNDGADELKIEETISEKQLELNEELKGMEAIDGNISIFDSNSDEW